jgi:hypothetical protein
MTFNRSDDPRIAAHLAAVAEALAATPGAANAQTVLDHLRGHIGDALAEHASDADPVATVLAELDPPQAYRTAAVPAAIGGTLGWWAFVLSLAAPLTGVLTGVVAHTSGLDSGIGWLVFTALELAAAAAGIVAWRTPWGRIAVACAVGVYVVLLALGALFPR